MIPLLLYFAMTLSTCEPEVNITHPASKPVEIRIPASGEIMINISKSGSLMINDQQLDDEKLSMILNHIAKNTPNQPIHIRADKATTFDSVTSVLMACQKAGLSNVSFIPSEDDATKGTSL